MHMALLMGVTGPAFADTSATDITFSVDSEGSSAIEVLSTNTARVWQNVAVLTDGTAVDVKMELVATNFDGAVEAGVSGDDLVLYLNRSATNCSNCQPLYRADIKYSFIRHDTGAAVSMVPSLTIKDINGWTDTEGYEAISTPLESIAQASIEYYTDLSIEPNLADKQLQLKGLAAHDSTDSKASVTFTFTESSAVTISYVRIKGNGNDVSSSFYMDGNIADNFYSAPVLYARNNAVAGDIVMRQYNGAGIPIAGSNAATGATVAAYLDGVESCVTAVESSGDWRCDLSTVEAGQHEVIVYAIHQGTSGIEYGFEEYQVWAGDQDGDGVLDTNDAFPSDATESVDSDNDGIGDNADTDDDGDGYTDSDEIVAGTDPLDNQSIPTDTDQDKVSDASDIDDDNNGLIEIQSLAELDAMRNDLVGSSLSGITAGCPESGCRGYELVADLDFDTNADGVMDENDKYWNDGAGWMPVGGFDNRFTSTFEGNGHEIRNLFVNRGDQDQVGLFGYVMQGKLQNISLTGALTNLTGNKHVGVLSGYINQTEVSGCYVSGELHALSMYTGGVTGLMNGGSMTNCHSDVTVYSGQNYVGGLIGYALNQSIVTNTYATGAVKGVYFVGGLIGQSSGLNLTASYATGSAYGGRMGVGGLIGRIIGETHITASFATGSASGYGDYAGGLVGYAVSLTLTGSYATGAVSSHSGSNTGGLVGYAEQSTLSNNYWAVDSTAMSLPYATTEDITETANSGVNLAELQCPVDADNNDCVSGVTLYAGWNNYGYTDSEGAFVPYWNFGTHVQLPALLQDGTVHRDTDGDGVWDEDDAFPQNPDEWADMDGDGIGDQADADQDGDGFDNAFEVENGTDPHDSSSYPDIQLPGISLLELPSITTSASVELSGTVQKGSYDLLRVDVKNVSSKGEDVLPVTVNSDGTFARILALAEGQNQITAVVYDQNNNQRSVSALITLDSMAPLVTISVPNTPIKTTTLVLNGRVEDTSGIASLTINNALIDVTDDGAFSADINLAEGTNHLSIVAIDVAGNQAQFDYSVVVDSQAPTINLQTQNTRTRSEQLTIAGSVADASVVTVTVNDQVAELSGDAFTATVSLQQGVQNVVVTAIDALGNQSIAMIQVELDTTGPVIGWTLPASTNTALLTVSGSAQDASGSVSKVSVTNVSLGGTVFTAMLEGSQFNAQIVLTEGNNELIVTATDDLGNQSSATQNVTLENASSLSIEWLSHQSGATVKEDKVVLEGLIHTELAADVVTLTINGQAQNLSVWSEGELSFRSQSISLDSGENIITVTASAADEQLQQNFVLYYQDGNDVHVPLTIDLNRPADHALVSGENVTVAGELYSESLPVVRVNGYEALVMGSEPTYRFSLQLPLIDVSNLFDLQVSVTNSAGETASAVRQIVVDNTAPEIVLDAPLADYPEINTVITSPYRFSGKVSDMALSGLALNDNSLSLSPVNSSTYAFSTSLNLPAGENTHLTLAATDLAGNRVSRTWIVQSTRSVSLNWVLPLDNSQLITQGEVFEVQLVLQVADTSSDIHYEAQLIGSQGSGVPVALTVSGNTVSGNISFPADAGDYTVRVRAISSSQNELAVTERSVKVVAADALEVALLKTTPEANAEFVATKDPISLFFNQSIDPALLSINVYETAHGKTWLNQDAPGEDFINAKGHQLIDVDREHEPVTGELSVQSEQRIVIFTPDQEPAYGATLFVEVSYDGAMLSRYIYQTEPLPTLVSAELRDQFNQPVNGLIVTLSSDSQTRQTVSQNGALLFGFASKEMPLPQGDYWLHVNPGLANTAYGETRAKVTLSEGRLNALGQIPVPLLNQEVGQVLLQSGQTNTLLNGAVQLDLSQGEVIFPDGDNSGAAHLQFNLPAGINTAVNPIAVPQWMYSFQPQNIRIQGAVSLRMEMPERQNSYDYLPEDGSLGLFLGVDPTQNLITPLGLVRLAGHTVETVGNPGLQSLDHIGVVFLAPAYQDLLQDYEHGNTSLQGVLAQILSRAQSEAQSTNGQETEQ
ncbi:GLUG motif-containing protein [Gynuella sp.]|uniref:GLUG motif-containing protein n=1 Tax=Gynuella sp. TaxID=2969146 RepID=UPI003D0987EB